MVNNKKGFVLLGSMLTLIITVGIGIYIVSGQDQTEAVNIDTAVNSLLKTMPEIAKIKNKVKLQSVGVLAPH